MLKISIGALKYLNALTQAYKGENAIRITTLIGWKQQRKPDNYYLFERLGRDKEELT